MAVIELTEELCERLFREDPDIEQAIEKIIKGSADEKKVIYLQGYEQAREEDLTIVRSCPHFDFTDEMKRHILEGIGRL